MSASMIERVASAWTEEWERWVCRTNTDGCEACRFDDSGFAGEFSVIHNVGFGKDYASKFEALRRNACARAAIDALREPTEGMLKAARTEETSDLDGRHWPGESERVWPAMIDAILKEPQ